MSCQLYQSECLMNCHRINHNNKLLVLLISVDRSLELAFLHVVVITNKGVAPTWEEYFLN